MLTGRCQCAAVRYQVDADPVAIYCCHCTQCRRQSSSAFGISVIVPVAGLTLLQGAPRIWSRPTLSGKKLDCAFCPTCGSRLWHVEDPPEATQSLKGGLIDGGIDLTGAAHIWTASRLPGTVLPPDVPTFPGEPD